MHWVWCYMGQPYTYYAGMAWSDFDVRSSEEWHLRVTRFLRTLAAPLQRLSGGYS